MQRRFHQMITSLKEHTCVNYAKIATLGGLCDINLIILKATSPDDFPLPEKYVRELLKIFSISPSSCRAFALSFARRFGKTRAWRVALKCLVLLHRLLRGLSDPGFLRAELLWTRTNGVLSLYPCNFRDSSSSASEDYTAFVRSYARLLDEALDCSTWIMRDEQNKRVPWSIEDDHSYSHSLSQVMDEEKVQLKMQELGRMREVLPEVQSIIDRVIDCRPAGAAARSFLVQMAMKQIVRDSFSFYAIYRREIVAVLENLIQLPYRRCVTAFGIYKKAAYQADHLCEFLEWSKTMGHCGSYEYPFVDRIPEIQITALETFLNGMWQLTDQSSSSSNVQSPVSLTMLMDNDCGEGGVGRKGIDMGPLMEWEDESGSVGWEDLLEASIGKGSIRDWQLGNGLDDQVFNGGKSFDGFQTTNPFYQQQCRMALCHGSCPNTPIQPWGL